MKRALVFAAALPLVACEGPTPVTPAPSAPPSASSTPSVDASGPVVTAVVDAGPPPTCLIKELRENANVDFAWSQGDSISFCIVDNRTEAPPRECYDVDAKSGAYTLHSDLTRDQAPKTRVPGRRRMAAHATDVEVCAPDGSACKTIKPVNFKVPRDVFAEGLRAQIPSDLSPDGKRLFLVRHEGDRSSDIFGETYDVASGQRLSRAPIDADEHVNGVWWVGKLALVMICVDEGPGCSISLLDPVRGTKGSFLVNGAYADAPVHHVKGALWAVVDGTGGSVVVVDGNTGKVARTIQVPDPSVIEHETSAGMLDEKELYVVLGGPVGGKVVIVDVERGTVARTFQPPPVICPGAP